MKLKDWIHRVCIGIIATLIPVIAYAQSGADTARDTGVSGLWMLANISYAGMRAQDNPSGVWRVLSFIFGFPGTLLSWLVIQEGSERAYGIDLPRKTS